MKEFDDGVKSREWTRGRVRKLVLSTGIAALSCAAIASCGTSHNADDGANDGGEAVGEVQQAATTAVSFQNGVLPTTSYTGNVDTSLKQVSPTTNFGGETTLFADGDDGSGVDLSSLLKWGSLSVPAGSTVTAASITLQVVNATGNTYNVYQVLRNWGESGATWQNATSSTTWATAGAMGSSDRGSVVGTVTGGTGSRVINLNAAGITMVQSWVNGGANNGVIIASASNTDGIDFASSEGGTASQRPKLTITYSTGTGGTGGTGGTSGTGGTGGIGGTAGTGGTGVSTDPNLKIAFIGDTDQGSNFTSVLNLVKNESPSAIVVQGDMSYSANPTAWWNAFESVMGTSFPVFISRGNHDDSSWSGYLGKAANHLGGATRQAGAHDANYKTTYRGLVIATIKKGDSGANITPFLSGDNHIWKICNWHQNQAAMQIGGKGDEMGWDVYETCRNQGAIIMTGHEHSYERTKTLTNMVNQTVDSSCASASSLCVGPGRTFVNVTGLGGNSVRDQTRCLPATAPYGCKGEWAFIYTTNQSATHGAQFITFNAGSAKHATGYFKNIDGATVDTFSINHD